jgi:hypothetical protein
MRTTQAIPPNRTSQLSRCKAGNANRRFLIERSILRPKLERALLAAPTKRMGQDSNLRRTRALSGFQDRRLRPLGHPSESIYLQRLAFSIIGDFCALSRFVSATFDARKDARHGKDAAGCNRAGGDEIALPLVAEGSPHAQVYRKSHARQTVTVPPRLPPVPVCHRSLGQEDPGKTPLPSSVVRPCHP